MQPQIKLSAVLFLDDLSSQFGEEGDNAVLIETKVGEMFSEKLAESQTMVLFPEQEIILEYIGVEEHGNLERAIFTERGAGHQG